LSRRRKRKRQSNSGGGDRVAVDAVGQMKGLINLTIITKPII